MKKSIIILMLGGLMSFLGFTSCEDFLEADNRTSVTAGEQFSTQEGFETLVNQAYFTMREAHTNSAIFCLGTDLYSGIRSTGDATLEGYSLTSDNGSVKDLYVNLYSVVNAANAVLYFAEDCEDFAEKDLRKEEARFLRAYAYYVLSQHFGRLPIVESYINTDETSYQRNSLQATYDFIIGELEKLSNSALLSEVDITGRANKQAAKALLAKVYLAAGWDLETSLTDAQNGTFSINGSSYFSKAAATAKEVADAVSLSQTFEEKWSPFNEGNEEVIFAIQWDRATALETVEGGYSQQNDFGTYLGSTTLGLKFVDSDMNPTAKAFHLYEKGDQRYDATFMTTILNYSGAGESDWVKQGYWAYYNASATEQANLGISFYFPAWYVTDAEIADYQAANADRFISVDDVNVAKIARTSDPLVWIEYDKSGAIAKEEQFSYNDGVFSKVGSIPTIKKFDDPSTSLNAETANGSYRDLVILNVSDIYLVAAEAYLMAGNESESLNYLNMVRSRAGADAITSFADYRRYDPSQATYVAADQYIDVILDERARELLGEYYRWMDLRRTRQLVKYNIKWNVNFKLSDMEGANGDLKWLRPIPADEIELNTGITPADQNPGYSADSSNE